ncbi:hypothetical protein [Absidia glauca]|uniref:Transcription factor domain-containing protein n=1 Tax=Absidia glauca TaxID=4829 RepID=A0A168LWI5_ABSGL|nr:hypothetical protein [Absidia glauca]
MIHSTQHYVPWSSLSISSGDDYSSCESNLTHSPPTTPLYYKPLSSSDLYSLHSPPLTPEQLNFTQQPQPPQQQQQQQQQKQQQQGLEQQLQLLQQHIPPSINIQLNDYGLCLDTNFTDIARLRNYLLSFVVDLPSSASTNSSMSSSSSSLASQGCSPLSTSSSTFSNQLVPRNKRYRNKPANLFKRFYELGQLYINVAGGGGGVTIPLFFQQLILRQQTVTACIHAYFDCWVRYFPVFPRQHILAILDEPRGLDSVIVNAIAFFVLKHMLAHHHYPPALEPMRRDPAKIRDMEEFFFTAAKNKLEQLLFDDDGDNKTAVSRFDIMGMLLMSYKVDMKKKSIYMTMAVQSLQSLQIHPGDDDKEGGLGDMEADDDADDATVAMDTCSGASACGPSASDPASLWKAELDTRLWWMTWMNDFAVSSSGSSTNMLSSCFDDGFMKIPTSASTIPSSASSTTSMDDSYTQQQQQQQQKRSSCRRRRVPRLWSFDCDGASEYGIMVNEHCLSIWRMQAEIIQHHYTSSANENDRSFFADESAVGVSSLETFDTQLNQFSQNLPMELQGHLPYDATPVSLVRARVHLELNATRIVLHKLYIPDDIDDASDAAGVDSIMADYLENSVNSLQWRSLNICLTAALDQVKIMHHCVMVYPSVLRCGFDRDELWRAAEIISVAIDVLAGVTRRFGKLDQERIEQQILYQVASKDALLNALDQSLVFVQNTYELLHCNNSNFRQLEEWLKDRIAYHKKHIPTHPTNPPQQYHQHHHHQHHHQHQHQKQPLQHTYQQPLAKEAQQPSRRSRSTMKKRKTSSSSTTSSTSTSSFDQQISFATGPCVFTSPTKPNTNNTVFGSSSQAPPKTRFRYFSPKQNRGLLFIDENPVNG